MTVGSLFAGIGGFDLGFEQAGLKICWQVENNRFCNELLQAKWPHVERYGDIRDALHENLKAVDIICGGDPCPSRSLAKLGQISRSPDLAGYFLAVIGRLCPQWVVRENVPAPNALDFAAGLEMLGYGVVAFALDARDFTSQSRRREIIVGCPPGKATDFKKTLLDTASGFGFYSPIDQDRAPVTSCVTAHPMGLAAADSYCYEEGRGLRILIAEECEALQGFPMGWTAGFPKTRRRKMLGNAIPVPFAKFIGKLIKEV